MTAQQLIENLFKFDGDIEVRIMNIAIEDDGHCPTFEIGSVEEVKGCVCLEFEDKDYIQTENLIS
jgi:hypothetical protein